VRPSGPGCSDAGLSLFVHRSLFGKVLRNGLLPLFCSSPCFLPLFLALFSCLLLGFTPLPTLGRCSPFKGDFLLPWPFQPLFSSFVGKSYSRSSFHFFRLPRFYMNYPLFYLFVLLFFPSLRCQIKGGFLTFFFLLAKRPSGPLSLKFFFPLFGYRIPTPQLIFFDVLSRRWVLLPSFFLHMCTSQTSFFFFLRVPCPPFLVICAPINNNVFLSSGHKSWFSFFSGGAWRGPLFPRSPPPPALLASVLHSLLPKFSPCRSRHPWVSRALTRSFFLSSLFSDFPSTISTSSKWIFFSNATHSAVSLS